MERKAFLDRIEQVGVVPVAVIDHERDAVPLARALAAGGLPAVEVTFRTPAAEAAIAAIARACPEVLVGAGTVLNVDQATRAVAAGAQFVVSPGYDPAVVDWCLEQGVNVVPAAVTPSELTALVNRGIDVTKFFPASLFGGKAAIDSLAAVFVGHRFMPTGGVKASNLADYLRDEAIIACGGTWMCTPSLFSDGDFSEVERLSREAADIVRAVRMGSGG